jgi:glycosyltransferase involved in cell wall biosynthesis
LPPTSPPLQRVLLIHNRYRAVGGEERVVGEIETLLRSRGHAVTRLERDSAQTSTTEAGRALLRGGLHEAEVAAAVRAQGADIVHAHNLHPLLGWRALVAARGAGAGVVLHLHNHRLVCAIGVTYRDGRPCFECHGRDTRPGVRHRCRGSLPEALVYAAGLSRQQPRLLAAADQLVVVSAAQAARLEALGVRQSFSVLANPAARLASSSRASEGRYVLAAGRLVEGKGFATAVAAALKAGVPLRIAGSGPEEARLRALAAGGDIDFLGWLSEPQLAVVRADAAAVLVPSREEEFCPMAVVDALAAGVPVLASDHSGLHELLDADSLLDSDDADAWSQALLSLWRDPGLRAARGTAALARARERHGADAYYTKLMEIYGAARDPR